MTTLVLGCTGWIGAEIQRRLGTQIVAPISSIAQRYELSSWIGKQRSDTYLNSIGRMSGTEAEMEWSNIGVVELLLDHASKTGARVINLGSAAEYGPISTRLLSESLEPNPVAIYGKQKLVANQMLNEFVKSGGSGVATRIFNVVGPGQSKNTALGQVIARMREQATGSEMVIDNFDVVRDYISLDYVVNVLLNLSSCDFNGTLNIASGKPVVLFDLLMEVGVRNSITVLPGNLQEDRVTTAVADTAKLREIGFEIEDYSLNELALLSTRD